MISRATYLSGTIVLLITAVSAYGNSTSSNGFVQTNGNTGIDFSNLYSGNFRITITSTGQINFRYSDGTHTFDSNPEPNILDLAGNRSLSWDGSVQPANVTVTQPIRFEERPAPDTHSYVNRYDSPGSSGPSQLLSSPVTAKVIPAPSATTDAVTAAASVVSTRSAPMSSVADVIARGTPGSGPSEISYPTGSGQTEIPVAPKPAVMGGIITEDDRISFRALLPTTVQVSTIGVMSSTDTGTPLFSFFSDPIAQDAVPEPATVGFVLAALAGIGWWRKRLRL